MRGRRGWKKSAVSDILYLFQKALREGAQENFPAFFQVLACKEICFLFFLACGFLKRHTER